MPLVHLEDGFGSRCAVAPGTVWTAGVVVLATLFDKDFGLPYAVEGFKIEPRVAEPACFHIYRLIKPKDGGTIRFANFIANSYFFWRRV